MAEEQITTLLRFFDGIEVNGSGTGAGGTDIAGGLDELFPPAGVLWPGGTADGPCGGVASFSSGHGLAAQDLLLGGTLLTRNLTVMALMKFSITAQNADGTPGTIVARGRGNGATEYMPFAVELHVLDVAARLVEVRFLWNTNAGVLKTQIGGHFVAPPSTDPDSYFLLTCTRRWLSPTSVVLRYYLGAQLVAEIPSVDGDIGGAVDGTTSIGMRFTGGVYTNFLDGSIDELAIANYEMAQEEIAATWHRLKLHQPDGYRMLAENLPPGLPISDDPTSNAQRDLQSMGAHLGFVAAQVENMRENFIPDRAYGSVLRDWEEVTKQPPKPGDDVYTRRARVIAHLRKQGGASPPAVQKAESDLLQAAPEQLAVRAFDNTLRDSFATLQSERWQCDPVADWDVIGGELRAQAAAGTFTWDGATLGAKMALVSVESPTNAAIFAKLDPITLPANGEFGLLFFNLAHTSAFFVGIRNVAGAYKLGYQRYTATLAIDGAFVVLENMAGLAPRWVRLKYTGPGLGGTDDGIYSISTAAVDPAETDFTTTAALHWVRAFDWAGFYFRTNGATGGVADARATEFAMRQPNGKRPFYFYVFRDPAIPGTPDLFGGQQVLGRMKHANTHAAVITSKSLLCDDPASVCDHGPMGCL